MAEETAGTTGSEAMLKKSPKPEPEKDANNNGGLDVILKTVKLDWIRPLIWRLGGRKMLAGGAGLAVINEIVKSDLGETAKIIVCISAAVVAVGTAISIAIEDRKGK